MTRGTPAASPLLRDLLATADHYRMGAFSLSGLEVWLLGHLQAILDAGDPTALALANRVDADLLELCEGRIDEAEVRRRFMGYVAEIAPADPAAGNGAAEHEENITRPPSPVPGRP